MKNKTLAIVLGIFALVIVTIATSFAFFTYSRTGETTTTITSGDIEFSYIEGTDASLTNAFPVKDEIGAIDTKGEYKFDVKMISSSNNNKINYNVILLDNNKEKKDYFTNDQIKFALVKNGTYVADTKSTKGRLMSSIEGFNPGETTGEGIVLQNQEITSGITDNYKLRIWISDTVDYSNGNEQTVNGKYNKFTYSLKVKVTTNNIITTRTTIKNINMNGKTITFDLSDPNGLDSYAITQENIKPKDNEWIKITDKIVRNNVLKISNSINNETTITTKVKEYGNNYLHVKNSLNEIMTKEIFVPIVKYKILFNTNDGEINVKEKEVIMDEPYGELPTPIKTGYIFNGWYKEQELINKITKDIIVEQNKTHTIYAKWKIPCSYEVGKVFNFNYNGREQIADLSCEGTYKLEVWGAQGGFANHYTGGKGGYSSGELKVTDKQRLYINVGGAGSGTNSSGQYLPGGYNGGGTVTAHTGVNHINGSGGGATHISKKSGLLQNLASNKESVLIVAGGGGGGRNQSNHENAARWGYGGTGGGLNGGGAVSSNGTTGSLTTVSGSAGTQTSGFAFGKGQGCHGQSGGGSGWYGGYGGCHSSYTGCGSGGSGYIGGVINGSMQNGVKEGHGFAKITVLSLE